MTENCEECSDKGFHHCEQESIKSNYRGIVRCTDCNRYENDMQAALAHALAKCCSATLYIEGEEDE